MPSHRNCIAKGRTAAVSDEPVPAPCEIATDGAAKTTFENVYAAALFLESVEDDREFEHVWQACLERFTDDDLIWQEKPRRLSRRQKFEEATALIDARDFGSETDRDRQLLKADLLYNSRAHGRSDAIFDRLIAHFPDDQDLRIIYARRLMLDGRLVKCRRLLEPIEDNFPSGTQACKLSEHTRALMAILVAKEGRPLSEDEDARICAMKHAILRYRKRTLRAANFPGLGKVALITGSLGAGGAERQISRLVMELEKARRAGQTVSGIEIPENVELLVRAHGEKRRKNFFLPLVQANDISLHEISSFSPKPAQEMGFSDPELRILLSYLPPITNYGVSRLTPYLLEKKFDVVSAWQDGACLFSALAALVAGVPQIHLVMRGLPPSLRRHIFRPDYEVLYRALAEIPGVHFLSNSKTAADAYSDWLGMPRERFSILYNGVEPMSPDGDDETEQMWKDFKARTPDATRTLGGVFRFETEKQPHVWMHFAAKYLQSHPDTRFVVVGGGRLFKQSKKLAEDLGIADRILFTNRSKKVGYWMTRMDVLIHLSRFEGLPNVLIEAQYMGLRVVATPAGGAAECIVEGLTGRVLSSWEEPDYEEVTAYVNELLRLPDGQELFAPGGAGRAFLDSHFSVSRMLGDFATLCADNAPAVGQGGSTHGKDLSAA